MEYDLLTLAEITVSIFILAVIFRLIVLPKIRIQAKYIITQILNDAKIKLGKDLVVYSDDVYLEWLCNGQLGIGETYMAGKWEATGSTLDEIFTKLMGLPWEKKRKLFKSWNTKFATIAARLTNYQSKARAGMIGAHHYDLGNDFFELWLDSCMQYSCAYWKNAETLEEAQLNKLRMIAQKLKLEPGMKVLEIGFGWGGLACFLAKNYSVHVTGITVSEQQLHGAKKKAESLGLESVTDFHYADYREMKGEYDRVVSIAMMEAVGYKNLKDYYSTISRCLKPGGIALVHTIANNRSFKTSSNAPWIIKYIFPNGFLPSMSQMAKFSEGNLVIEDVQNIGPDYDRTLLEWNQRFQQAVSNGEIFKSKVFVRMWEFYLLYCAAGFRTRSNQVYQVAYTKRKRGRYDRE